MAGASCFALPLASVSLSALSYCFPAAVTSCALAESSSCASGIDLLRVGSLHSRSGWNRQCCRRFQCLAIAEMAQQAVDQPQSELEAPLGSVDSVTMVFKAEGTLIDSAVPKVVSVLQDIEGVSNVKVSVTEGIATAEVRKQMDIQATGVASSLVAAIQNEGFNLQHLSLSFDNVDDIFDDDVSSYEEEVSQL
eukprot:c17745_g1_i1 orf=277-855(-)